MISLLLEGMTTILAITILQTPDLDLTHIADVLDWFFMLLPQYNLGIGIVQISTNSLFHRICPFALDLGTCAEGFVLYNPESFCCTQCKLWKF